MKNWRHRDGAASPPGVTLVEQGTVYNFALFSQAASSVELIFFRAADLQTPCYRFLFDPLHNKTGPVWHARVPLSVLGGAAYYAYQIDGPCQPTPLNYFAPDKLLVDPYARNVFFPPSYQRSAALGTSDNAGSALLSALPTSAPAFDWGNDKPPRHFGDLVIYEMHVGGYTRNPNSGVSDANRGTFQGIVEKIPYLTQLGITAVELMPVFAFDETEPNYWGYMPIGFFAPHHKYLTADDISDFKQMVKALHAAGIEVLLDVVFNHSGEGDELGPVFHFKGIDAGTYYMASGDPSSPFADFTGTGNTLNCSQRAVRQLILDSLRYWVYEMHVDGFRFDLASVFSRNADGSINFQDPPIFGDIQLALERVRLIAEPWEGNLKYPNYELGEVPGKPHFPGTGWRQWNDRFRTTVRHVIKSDSGYIPDLMTRLYGSADLFPDALPEACRPYQTLNYVDSHDGATLYDLVAYNSDESWNCGGPDGEANLTDAVLELRKRQVKNFCAVLMLSNGTPMFHAGDEFLRTQSGNTNPYKVDSTFTWVDWDRLNQFPDVFRFFSKMISFRKDHSSIGRSTFWRDDVHWYGVSGGTPDLSYDSHAVAYALLGASEGDDDLYVMINTYWEPLVFTFGEGTAWRRIVDTYQASPDDFVDESAAVPVGSVSYTVQPRSIAVFVQS